MNTQFFSWYARPGLAGGVDKDGSRAGELLAIGFGSVEFGSVMPDAVSALVTTLSRHQQPSPTVVGLGLGLPPEWPADNLADAWLTGLNAVGTAVDYLSFNLSAMANRRFLHDEHRGRLTHACQAVAGRRDVLAAETGRRLPLAMKLPLGTSGEPLPAAALVAVAAGFDQLTVVLPEGAEKFSRLAELARQLKGGPALVAVGGLRSAASVAAARQAGAAGIQVHRLFVEQGAACLAALEQSAA